MGERILKILGEKYMRPRTWNSWMDPEKRDLFIGSNLQEKSLNCPPNSYLQHLRKN